MSQIWLHHRQWGLSSADGGGGCVCCWDSGVCSPLLMALGSTPCFAMPFFAREPAPQDYTVGTGQWGSWWYKILALCINRDISEESPQLPSFLWMGCNCTIVHLLLKPCSFSFFLKNFLFIYYFGCAGSSLLKGVSAGQVGPAPWLQRSFRCGGFSRWHGSVAVACGL